jgi:hypothetical protein
LHHQLLLINLVLKQVQTTKLPIKTAIQKLRQKVNATNAAAATATVVIAANVTVIALNARQINLQNRPLVRELLSQ